MADWLWDHGGEGFAQAYRVDEVFLDAQSPYQRVRVIRTPMFGRMLILDDAVQTSEADEFCYHEMLAHPPLLTHPQPRRVLIIGGGDGGLLEEVLKHPVERVVMVEIDRLVVDATLRHIPEIPGRAFDDPRTELRIEDGFAYVRDCQERFDVALVDSTDPQGPSVPLFGEAFYGDLFRLLGDDGVLAVQSGSPLYQADLVSQVRRHLRTHFPVVRTLLTCVPSYPGVLWTFTLASKRADPLDLPPEAVDRRVAGMGLRYYTGLQHRAALNPPPFLRSVLEG
ncbi:MAG: polyamine aminopropyltransferase [Armatimonadota bacterium]|nr:polyamine aminopropyltransferase [Armatimonadota bacterium]MDW8157217.1 polyamine aminopropyltransferase [Armatimonadota bacterium]